MRFDDRADAGRELGERLRFLRERHPIVLGLPRGGVVVAREVADALGAPLDALLVRKIGAPRQPELAVGAVGEGGVLVTNTGLQQRLGLSHEDVEAAARHEFAELDRRAARYRRGRPALAVTGRTVVLVDDGVATGATVRAALRVLRARGAGRVVLAVPVAPADVLEELAASADHTVCPNPRVWMRAVGHAYRDFPEVTDAQVIALLDEEAGVTPHRGEG
ncbi:phosphoribosyltransferase [Prauserella muralis]|uniref:Phosphoribosyltransferase domain-containing protein n=1 Tax=Prauserella muralis TaxID=588067 RepID=A0A2V4APJ3_9PSEU|nr:phosphoribosyltransferase family protein [Prauserella muralis]PXY22269.1 hypothetical protein BAY60_20540 [Prauserella muralis]TWE27910.1 putative phosphoribosyltransferase [Prauserella muralis]